MKTKIHLNLINSVLIFLCFTFHVSAQIFERAESISGLGNLEQNNGVAVADFNGDNAMDMFVVAKAIDRNGVERTHSRLYRNNNDGSFTDVTNAAGLSNLLIQDYSLDGVFYGFDGFKIGAFWGDYDNDGFPDLFLTNTFNVQLFRNLGDGTFQNVTATAGFNLSNSCQYTGATWFDFNNDGFLDIYICDWGGCTSNSLYQNNGDGTFTDVTVSTGIQEVSPRQSFTAMPYDFNDDGFLDLYVSNDFDLRNYLYINQGGTGFLELATTVGLGNNFDDMGIAMGDYDNDGDFDFYITGIDETALFTNNGNNTFTENAAANNVFGAGWAWGTKFADFDLDGDDDLFVTNGYIFEGRGAEYNVYFKNNYVEGLNNFTDATVSSNLHDSTIGIEALDFDYDNDGDLDLYVTNSDSHSYLYENKTLNFDQPNPIHYLKVSLEGVVSNRSAIGTELTIVTNSGTFKKYFNGVGFLGQSIKPVIFGLNAETTVTSLTIKWPSGLVETHSNLTGDTHVKATEGAGIVTLSVSPSVKIYGCTDPQSCSYDPAATVNDNSCTYLTSGAISGAINTRFLEEQIYSYPSTPGSTTFWEVSGGELVSGQGTGQITVRWGVNELGSVSVIENDGSCYSPLVSLNVTGYYPISADISIARVWNEVLLEGIRKDFARPTVHARNLFHSSVAMYDIWAIYDAVAEPYLMGNQVHGFTSVLESFTPLESNELSNKKAISYAMYRLIQHRFQNSPGVVETLARADYVMDKLNYPMGYTGTNYQSGNAADLGNYVAETIINYGFTDGSREATEYDNAYYEPINPPLAPAYENNTIIFPNRWQPLSLDTYIDQSGNLIDGALIAFLGPEWGNVNAFALSSADRTTFQRDGDNYQVYKDPGAPPFLDNSGNSASSDAYKWNFSLVSIWGSHLDPADGVMWDISPNAIGNISISSFPTNYLNYPSFYDVLNGGDPSTGRNVNPSTGQAYAPQMVPRGDYTRVLAEFWADGPDSETPPGHWFTLLNHVSDHPQFVKQFNGTGATLDALEWDVKSYFILGGAMHDSAITAWGIKGWYDYIRPISAIRYMASKGQSTNQTLSNYDPEGIPLQAGFIEVVESGDPLAGALDQHVGKIKLNSWKGPDFVNDPGTDTAGVGWILSEDWWPYQRPSFVTPPFSGFVSGHSTYSRAAAEVMTLITGDEYFPGGMGEFIARQNEFLVFEDGPSVDVVLQWATYRDASDQCSLSRIWGGIHPPADDIPGRLIGEEIGIESYNFAVPYFTGNTIGIEEFALSSIFPNPVNSGEYINISNSSPTNSYELFDISGRYIKIDQVDFNYQNNSTRITIPSSTSSGVYFLRWNGYTKKIMVKKGS
ncbi:FG-GAP-like repeat-containing protein [Xanthomarina sp. F2636L]|uniref:FG-GAP-like repeat-containing protein n=1 Tax=Xanthomarina sp. F2636L TaxID=2996018 RepID=UPI00225DFD8B|nr:FG-GAP-like repeat-containing protein [Xanthomarina sp. F2636L]MCX7551912.1 FG-GAP-like repeat-containing protein [Xanthomarina sp. F2636L]